MSNFDLRKYLAESKLVTEDKIDMINKYAHRIATGEEIQDEFFMDNKEEILQAADEIEKYMGSDADIPEAQKPSMKMKKSELKEMIKAAFLSEADFTNAQDDDAALGGMYDPVYEAEDEEYDYDDYDLNVEFKKSPNEASYEDVLDIIKSYEDEIILDDFKSEFPKGEPISKKDYSDFATRLIDDMSEVGFIQANWISIFDEDVFDKAGLVEGEDEEETAEREETAEEILARITGTKLDPYSLAEAKDEEEKMDITVDAEEETTDDGEEKLANDSIVVDKKIVSLSSLPQQTRKILDSLETLRAQAEEFGDQKFITQVGNTITFFTRDFVVAGDEPTKAKVDESLEILKMKKLAGLLTEGEYAKALLKEYELDDNKLQAFIDRYNKLPRKMGTLDGGDKSYIKDYIKSNPTKLEGEFDDALFSDEATVKFLNGLLDTPRGQNISFMKAKSQYKSKPSWVTGNDANPWGPGYDYEEYEEVPGI